MIKKTELFAHFPIMIMSSQLFYCRYISTDNNIIKILKFLRCVDNKCVSSEDFRLKVTLV